MKIICISCDQYFPTPEALLAHEQSGHTLAGTIMNSNPAPIMNKDFDATLQQIAEDKKRKEEEIKRLQEVHEKKSQEPEKPKVVKPLELTYKFIGNCDCGSEPKTIMVDVGEGYYATAYCIPEDKQLQSIKVEKLEKIPVPKFITTYESRIPLSYGMETVIMDGIVDATIVGDAIIKKGKKKK